MKRGTLVRVVSSHPTLRNEHGVVVAVRKDRDGHVIDVAVKSLTTRWSAQIFAFDLVRIEPDELTDEECAELMRWHLENR